MTLPSKWQHAAFSQFVYNANVSEDAGFPDSETTTEVLEGKLGLQIASSVQGREVVQLGTAISLLLNHSQTLNELVRPHQIASGLGASMPLEHRLEPYIVTPDLILEIHSVLCREILPNAGQYRLAKAFAFTPKGKYFSTEPLEIKESLLSVCDHVS